jgi:hypothetical protein
MLSSDEMTRIASNPEAVVNRNAPVAYDGVLGEGDILTIDSGMKTATLFDVSEGTRSNALDAVTGFIPSLAPGRRRAATDRTQTVAHVLNGAEVMEVRYRRMYL